MNLALASKRARHRVQALLSHDLPWLCNWRGGRGPKAGCTSVTDDEWRQIQAKGWPGITPCHFCARLDAPTQLPLPTPAAPRD